MTETDRNPFVGLRIFGFDQHRLFFGRQTQIDELLLRLDANHMLAITGPAGSGKSSLVRAGLMPRLLNGEDGDSWKTAILSTRAPGTDGTRTMPSTSCSSATAFRRSPWRASKGDVVFFDGRLIHRGGPILESGSFRHSWAGHYIPHSYNPWPYEDNPRLRVDFDGVCRFTPTH